MKRRDFLKSVSGLAAGAALPAMPQVVSSARADARSESQPVLQRQPSAGESAHARLIPASATVSPANCGRGRTPVPLEGRTSVQCRRIHMYVSPSLGGRVQERVVNVGSRPFTIA